MPKAMDPVQRLIQWFKQLERRVKKLETGARAQNSSVDDGAFWILSPEGLIVGEPGGGAGSARIYGTLIIDGQVEIDGTVTQTGTYTIPGSLPIVMEIVGGLPQITAGGGYVRGYGDGIAMGRASGGIITATTAGAALGRGAFTFAATAAGLGFTGVPTGTLADVEFWYGEDADGFLVKIAKSTGGPTGSGLFAWPFSLSTVSREYGPGYPEYDDGVHKGIDFAVGGGTAIPAPADGTVTANGYDAERGNYLILSHGTHGGFELTTRYYHLQELSPLNVGDAVTKGQTVGLVGTTGLSTGNHLHYETRRNGEHINPRSFMSIYGE